MRDKGRHELKKLSGDLGKSQLGFTEVSAGVVSRANERDTSGTDEVHSKFKPGNPSIKHRGMIRPRELGPVPLDGRISARLGVRVEHHRTKQAGKVGGGATSCPCGVAVRGDLGSNICQGIV